MENETHPVQRSLAPWTLKAESYLLFLKLKELPLGLYDRLEEAWEDENLGRFEGGLGAVMIVRYSETPVGGFFFTFSLHYIYNQDYISQVMCTVRVSTSSPLHMSIPVE